MAESRADDCIREFENLASRRGTFENHWREVAERVRPNANFFQMRSRTEGDKRNEKIFDDTAPLALPKFAAAMQSIVMPQTQRWHRLTVDDVALAEDDTVRAYLDAVTEILFKVRYAPQANFQGQASEVMLDIGAFGTGIMFIDDVLGVGIRYKAFPLAETYLAEDMHGIVDTVHRKFELSAHQAVKRWGARCPEAIRQAAEKDATQKFWFLQCVRPNADRKPGKRDYTGMAYSSCYIAYDNRQVVDDGGYRSFPFACPRYETSPREVYGRGPAIKVLPTIKMINEAQKTIIRAAQKIVDPPIMLTEDGSLQQFNVRPTALNYGYLDQNGNPLARPFETGGRVDIGMDLLNSWREAINDAFFVTLFRILVDEPQITATEAMLRAQEKGQLLAPPGGRIQTEWCGPMIQRELDILAAAGVLPPMPDVLVEAGGGIKIEYEAPLNLAQRASEGVGILNTLNAVTPIAQFDPSVLKVFKTGDIARELAKINGMGVKLLRTKDEMEEMDAADAEAAQASQLLEAAPVVASASKDFAQAAALAGSGPNQIAPDIFGTQ